MHPRPTWRRIVLWLGAGLLTAQSLIIAVLSASSAIRKRRPASFPHVEPAPEIVEGDKVQLFVYGQDLYDAMLRAIDDARETIFFETFIWKGDQLGKTIKEHLERKAAAGVQVYVIFDGFANLVVRPSFKRFSRAINKIEYRSLQHLWYAFDPRRYARDHRKLLIVDNEIAFLGGYNIGGLYATAWRDTHLRMKGPAAADIGFAFVDFWNTNRTTQPAIAWNTARPWHDPIRVHRNDPGRLVFPIRGMYLDAIQRATDHIYLTNAYFIPDRVILAALIEAAHRGVDVRVLLPWQSNHPTADWLARGFFKQCLSHGVRIFGYKDAMIHAKTATIDGIWSTVGTANLDRLSLAGNYEINIEIRDPGFAATMEQMYMADLTNAFELTMERWARRPWYMRASQVILSPLRPLL